MPAARRLAPEPRAAWIQSLRTGIPPRFPGRLRGRAASPHSRNSSGLRFGTGRAVILCLAASLCPSLLAGGCSYSFSGTNLPGHIKSIAVPNVQNETLEPSLAQEVTDGVLGKFLQDGRLKVAPEAQADARLDARVVSYENKVRNYAPDQTPLDYIVVLDVAVTLWDQVKNRELWKDEGITRTAVYAPTGGGQFATEEEARQQAIADLANDLVSRTLEQW